MQRPATSRGPGPAPPPATASAGAAAQPQATPCQAAVGSPAHDVFFWHRWGGSHARCRVRCGSGRSVIPAITCHHRIATGQCTLRSGLSRMQCAPPARGSTASRHPGGRAPPPMPRPAATEFAVNMALPVPSGRCCPARMPCPRSLGVVRSVAAVHSNGAGQRATKDGMEVMQMECAHVPLPPPGEGFHTGVPAQLLPGGLSGPRPPDRGIAQPVSTAKQPA